MSVLPVLQAQGHAHRRAGARGFSLIELLVVIAIMSVLASIGMPLAELAQQRTKEEALRRSLREIRDALDAYKRLADEGRIERVAGGSGYPPKLEVLVEGVKDARSPQGTKLYLLRSLPRDPFAAADVQPAAATWALRSYASPPDDAKPGDDVFDVHSTSTAVGFDGFPYKQW
jgi:general secretion pathway protein G